LNPTLKVAPCPPWFFSVYVTLAFVPGAAPDAELAASSVRSGPMMMRWALAPTLLL
jgi:hypothetical protein